MSTFFGETIWVVGASSGIGEALCRSLALAGCRLIISARDESRLELVRQSLNVVGAGAHEILPFDVGSRESISKAFADLGRLSIELNRIIYFPAVYTPMSFGNSDLDKLEQTVRVNLLGAMYFTENCLSFLCGKRKCQIAYCASVAGYVGLPDGQPYSATKAGLINYVESLRASDIPNLDVRLICPGFVRTRLTDQNSFAMPAIILPEEAAKQILYGLQGKCFEIHFPKRFTCALKLLRLLPYRAYFFLMK